MIIFDLDGTLADCEHRRHFVDPSKLGTREDYNKWMQTFIDSKTCPEWKPDWKAFYEACDKDKPIQQTIDIFNRISYDIYGFPNNDISIWSGRSESVRSKTEHWLKTYVYQGGYFELKMRPIGDNTPDDQLKEKWLDEAIAEGKRIDYVFDDRMKVVDRYRKRGIFVFNCCQHDEEF